MAKAKSMGKKGKSKGSSSAKASGAGMGGVKGYNGMSRSRGSGKKAS